VAQKHIIEIIFDNSESMGWAVNKNDHTSRLDIAKYVFRELIEDIILPSSFEFRIQYFHGCNTHLATVNDIYSIKAYGATPLFRTIGNSLEYLLNFDKSYKKSIIILSDGEDTCGEVHHVSEKEIVNFIKKNPTLKDVKIYILKIGKVSHQAEKEYNYLVKKTEGKKYLVDLKNYKNTVNGIKKDLHSILNRSKIKSFFYSFFKFIRMGIFLLLFILLIMELYPLFKQIKPFQSQKIKPNIKIEEIIEKKIISCTEKTINKIVVNECTFIPNPLKKALIYNHKNSKIVILQNFASGKSELDKNSTIFINSIFTKQIRVKRIEGNIYGHSDLIPLNTYNSKDCIKEGINTIEYPNMCLAFNRALQVKKSLPKRMDELFIRYNNDFFMKKTNEELNGTLWKVMEIEDDVINLMKELHISKEYNALTIRIKFKENNINLKKYNSRFAPFRSVIIQVY